MCKPKFYSIWPGGQRCKIYRQTHLGHMFIVVEAEWQVGGRGVSNYYLYLYTCFKCFLIKCLPKVQGKWNVWLSVYVV